MTPARPRFLAWILLGIHALCGLTWGRGLVLCFEADGHVSLEASADCSSCCVTEGSEAEAPAPSLDACPCSDVPLGLPEPGQPKSGSAGGYVKLLPGVVVATLGVAAPSGVPVSRADLPRSHASHALRLVRTQVLRL